MRVLTAEHYIGLAGIYPHKRTNAHIFACFVQTKQTGCEAGEEKNNDCDDNKNRVMKLAIKQTSTP